MSTLTFDGSASNSAAYGRRVIARRAITSAAKPTTAKPVVEKNQYPWRKWRSSDRLSMQKIQYFNGTFKCFNHCFTCVWVLLD